jgi:phosphoribosyl isomerase A
MIDLLPAVDVAGGRVAWTNGGGPDADPLAAALRWQAAGARWVHLVDLDFAYGRGCNRELLAELVGRLDVAVELSGGIVDDDALAAALATGARRIVIGAAALARPLWVRRALARGGERLAVGLDVLGTKIVPRGASEPVGELFDVIRRCDADGCPRYVVTDVRRDGAMSGPNLDLLRAVGDATSTPLVASGGIATLGDVRSLASVPGIEGAIVGKALYRGSFTLEEALKAAA